MTLQKIELHKHEDSSDVAIQIIIEQHNPLSKRYDLVVRWWNIGPHEPYCMNIIEDIKIKEEDRHKWVPFHIYK